MVFHEWGTVAEQALLISTVRQRAMAYPLSPPCHCTKFLSFSVEGWPCCPISQEGKLRFQERRDTAKPHSLASSLEAGLTFREGLLPDPKAHILSSEEKLTIIGIYLGRHEGSKPDRQTEVVGGDETCLGQLSPERENRVGHCECRAAVGTAQDVPTGITMVSPCRCSPWEAQGAPRQG